MLTLHRKKQKRQTKKNPKTMIKRQTKKNRRYTKRSGGRRSGLLPIGKRNKTNNKRYDHERDNEFENLKKNILRKKID